jgi:hypothetical protein
MTIKLIIKFNCEVNNVTTFYLNRGKSQIFRTRQVQ